MLLNILRYLSIVFIAFSSVLILTLNFDSSSQQFKQQTQSFLSGKLDIPKGGDTVFKNGKYFWPLGVFPSFFLVPFVLISYPINQSVGQIFLIFTITLLAYILARMKGFTIESALYLTLAFLFGSINVGILLNLGSATFAQTVYIALLLLLIIVMEYNKAFVVGIIFSCLVATRIDSFLLLPFIFTFFLKHNKKKLVNSLRITIPVFICIAGLLYFNYVRFGNAFDNGFATNRVGLPIAKLRDLGMFSIVHVPTNFYYYFLSPIKFVIDKNSNFTFPFISYSTWGISFFIVCPFFIYAFKTITSKEFRKRLIWVSIFLILLTLLMYYNPGWVQFGPRYLADVLPLLYLLLLEAIKKPKLTDPQQVFILGSCILNCYLLLSLYFY